MPLNREIRLRMVNSMEIVNIQAAHLRTILNGVSLRNQCHQPALLRWRGIVCLNDHSMKQSVVQIQSTGKLSNPTKTTNRFCEYYTVNSRTCRRVFHLLIEYQTARSDPLLPSL